MPTVTPIPGDFGVVTTSAHGLKEWACRRAIQLDTDGPYNHAFLVVGAVSGYSEPMGIEGRPGGAGYVRLSAYPDAVYSTGRLPAALTPSVDQRRVIIAAGKAMLGDPYNWPDIAAISVAQRNFFQIIDPRIPFADQPARIRWALRRLVKPHREICSQLVDLAYLAAQIHLMSGDIPGLVSPNDLGRLYTPAPVAA